MSAPKVIAIGRVDERGIAGSQGPSRSWEELGVAPPGNARTYRTLSGRTDATYRRLDRQSRTILLATEACGVDRLLSVEEREETAIVTETSRGSIEVDLRYTRLLEQGVAHGAIFPYTLQSTCLGELALRYGLRGPTVSLSVEPGGEGQALQEARRLLAGGGVPFALAGAVDVLDEALAELGPVLRSVVCLLAPAESPHPEVAPVPDRGDPFAVLAAACR